MNDTPRINAMLIGADRSGTTWIRHLCAQHPDVYIVPGNQVSFYSNEYSKGIFRSPKINWDRSETPSERIILGRRNLKLKHSRAIPKLLYTENNDMKFIYIMRNPVDRCFSTYTQIYRAGENKTFNINEDSSFKECRIEYSFHFNMLEEYLNLFPRKNFFFMTIEQLRAQPQLWFDKLFSYLGIETGIELSNLDKHTNKRENKLHVRMNEYVQPTPELNRKIAKLCMNDAKVMSDISGIDLMDIWELDKY